MDTPSKEQLEARLHYPLGDRLPPSGRCLEVAPGVKWIRMDLPFALDHINLWLLRDRLDGRDGWTVVDCCVSRDEAKAQWERIFEHELQGLPVLRVIVTHMHPDHIGLANWLCERWTTSGHTCRLWISATDYHTARIGTQSTTGFGGESAARFFASNGLLDPDSLAQIRGRTAYYPSLVPAVPSQFHRIMDGQEITIGGRTWRCISGFGHAPEHIALHCAGLDWTGPAMPAHATQDDKAGPPGVLISGDMVLPRISTNVSVYEIEPESDALRLFLDSLEKYLPLPPATLVLPSHGKPFTGLHERIRQLKDHHRDRLEEVLQACREKPCSGADILPVMFKRPLDLHQTTFAMGEAVAHLHWWWYAGQLRRMPDHLGVWRFSPA